MAKKVEHVHRYERQEVGRNGYEVFRCMLPGCTHFLPNIVYALGRLSQCWGTCGDAVMIDKEMMAIKMKHPMCDPCREDRQRRKEAIMNIGREL